MAPTSSLTLLAALAALSSSIHAAPASSPLLPRQNAITPLTPAEVAAFKPYTWYAATVACQLSDIMDWNCGEKCDANPTFKPIATGGDGDLTQFCLSFSSVFGIPDADLFSSGIRVCWLRPKSRHRHRGSSRYRRL